VGVVERRDALRKRRPVPDRPSLSESCFFTLSEKSAAF
jgi:hypothetical protein